MFEGWGSGRSVLCTCRTLLPVHVVTSIFVWCSVAILLAGAVVWMWVVLLQLLFTGPGPMMWALLEAASLLGTSSDVKPVTAPRSPMPIHCYKMRMRSWLSCGSDRYVLLAAPSHYV
jgi:hypothetical protein